MSNLKIVFMGTPDFSVPALEKLTSTYSLTSVYCQPPRLGGRGYKPIVSPVHHYAQAKRIPVHTPSSFKKDQDACDHLRFLKPDLIIVAAYGLILPKEILDIPPLGCLNIHASLLPRWRGAAPIQRAIMAGDKETGVTIMKMEEGLDTGPILSQIVIPLTDKTTSPNLTQEMSLKGADLLIETLKEYEKGGLTPIPQPDEGVTYAHKLSKTDSLFSWGNSAESINCRIRALTPWPGVIFHHEKTAIKITKADVISQRGGSPGQVIDHQLTVACGKGALRLLRLKKSGGKEMTAEEFLNGYQIPMGTGLECPAIS